MSVTRESPLRPEQQSDTGLEPRARDVSAITRRSCPSSPQQCPVPDATGIRAQEYGDMADAWVNISLSVFSRMGCLFVNEFQKLVAILETGPGLIWRALISAPRRCP